MYWRRRRGFLNEALALLRNLNWHFRFLNTNALVISRSDGGSWSQRSVALFPPLRHDLRLG